MLSINIAICDDNKTSQIQVYEILKKYFSDQRIITSFYMFSDGKELLESKDSFDIIILDIKMEEVDGITVKDKLYLLGSDSKIIFLTGHSSQIQEAFGRNVYGFVDKVNILEIKKYIDIIITEFKRTRLISLSGYLIDIWKVHYIEADRVYSKLYTDHNEYKLVRKSLKDIAELLKDNDLFIRTHRSYMVNLRYVKGMAVKHLVLEEDVNIPISNLYHEDVKEKIKKYK